MFNDDTQGPQAWANRKYSEYVATSVPAYRAVTLRAQAVSAARPVVGMVEDVDGKKSFTPIGDEHPVQVMLDAVNDMYSRSDLWYATECQLSLAGSSYWLLDSGQIWLLHPDRMTLVPRYDKRGLYAEIDRYEYDNEQGHTIKLDPKEVIRFRRWNPISEMSGLSPIAPVRLSLDMGQDALRFNRNFFSNSAVPSDVAITYPGVLGDEEVQAFYKRWDERFRGANNAHRPILLQGMGVDAKRIGLSQRDMEFLAGLRWTVEDAARVWGVPPPLMYSQEASIYNNVSEANRDFWRSTVMAEWEFLAAQLNEHLLPRIAPEDGLEIRFDFSAILPLQESMAELNKEDREDVKANILTINEVREKRGLAPVDWGDDPTQSLDLFGMPPDQLNPKAPPAEKSVPYVEVFGRELRKLERTFGSTLSVLFQEQLDNASIKVKEGLPAFRSQDWIEPFSKRAMPLYERAVFIAAQGVTGRYNLIGRTQKRVEIPKVPVFTLADPEIRKWLDSRVRLWATLVNEETGRLINQEVIEASAAGESIRQVQDRLEKVFRFNDAVRTERIARTEMLSAANKGHLSAYEQSGVVERIQWVAANDERTRPSHAQASGQIVELGEPFHVGSALLDAPGVGHAGTMGPAEEVINCRCVSIPVFTQRRVVIDRPNSFANGKH